MTLRNRLLALSLLTLLLPWSGWKLLQELERFLREAQEQSLLSAAHTLAGTLPFETQSQLLFTPQNYLLLRQLERAPALDGYTDEWPAAGQGLELESGDGRLKLRMLAGRTAEGLHLVMEVTEPQLPMVRGNAAAGEPGESSRVELLLRSPRGLLRFAIQPEAPGPLQLHSEGGAGQAEGYWLDTAAGFTLELSLPLFATQADLGVQVLQFDPQSAGRVLRSAGSRSVQRGEQWISLLSEWRDVSALLANAVSPGTRAWLLNRDGWVLADSGPPAVTSAKQTTWAQRLMYRLVAGARTDIEAVGNEPALRFDSGPVTDALQGGAGVGWSQDPDTAVVHNTVAVPVTIEGTPRGVVMLQSTSEGLLLVTNRALSRLLLITLVITFGLAGGLWYFASRLSRRVLRLSGAVSEAMQDGEVAGDLPLVDDRDELGGLARNTARLLRAVADYNQYLQTLAGRLSHELKTPLAITRSSLDNLSSRPLDSDAQRFLQRAQEGLDRQTAIVRAMSESSRLEAAIRSADWEDTDLTVLLAHCAEGYRSLHPGRLIETRLPERPLMLHCAPELLAQALDKLVDNALSLTSPQHVISLRLEQDEQEARLAVRNQGSRLPDEYRERMFDSLVSLRDRRGETPHLGLGLYIVRLVAEAHGGRVDACNLASAGGVEFVMHLPLRDGAWPGDR